ncbi:MAG: hypothetical protein ACE5NP_01050 [Anaerolineae bacterium]
MSNRLSFVVALLFLGLLYLFSFWVSRESSCQVALSRLIGALTWEAINQGLESHAMVVALAVDPEDSDIAYAATYDQVGLYRTDDRGHSWQPMNDGLGEGPVLSLLLVPAGRAKLYAGTQDGVYYLDQGKGVWRPLGTGLPRARVYALTAAADGTLHAGADEAGVYRLTAGEWQAVNQGLEGVPILSLVAHPLNPHTLYAGSGGKGLYITTNGGASWTPVRSRYFYQAFVSALAIEPDQGETVLARTRQGLYQMNSRDGVWRAVGRGLGEEPLISAITFSPDDSRLVYLVTEGDRPGFYVSGDGGLNWQAHNAGLGIEPMLSLAVAPSDPAVIYLGSREGVYVSQDGGGSWRRANHGLGTVKPESLTAARAPGQRLWLASVDGVYLLEEGSRQWQLRGEGLPPKRIHTVAVAPSDPRVLYAGTGGAGVYRSDDGGLSWRQASVGLEREGIPALAVDPLDSQTIYAKVAFNRLFRSRDGGLSWDTIWRGMPLHVEVMSVAIDPLSHHTLYAGTTDGLFKSVSRGDSWRRLAGPLNGQTVFSLLVGDDGTVYAGATRGLYHSSDGGETWATSRDLEGITVSALAQNLSNPRLLYAGTKYRGLFVSADGGQSWWFGGQGLMGERVISLTFDQDGTLYAATDEGVYQVVDTNSCPR